MKTKTIKTPLMMAEACGLSCWPSIFVLENTFSHEMKDHPCLVPRLSRHSGKHSENRVQTQACLSYAEVHPVFAESNNNRPPDSKPILAMRRCFLGLQSRCFCLWWCFGLRSNECWVRACAWASSQAQSMTSARKLKELKHQKRSFWWFLLTTET